MPIPELHTARLRLRPMGPEDVEVAHGLYSDPEVTAFLEWTAPPLEEYRALYAAALERRAAYPEGLGIWGGFVRETGAFAGEFLLIPLEGGPEVEVGYYLDRRLWGRGYATEGAREVLRYGLADLGLPEVVAVVRPENHRSIGVVERLGMIPDGTMFVYEGESRRFVARRED